MSHVHGRGTSALPLITQPAQVQDMQIVVYFTLLQLFKKDHGIAQQSLQAVQVGGLLLIWQATWS